MKKILKIVGVLLGIILLLMIAAPFLFKDSIENMVRRSINENVNATVDWEEVDISLFRNFPKASIVINNFSVINNAPFEGDTLAAGETAALTMGITQLWKNETQTIQVDAFSLNNSAVHIVVNEKGQANYDIAKNTSEDLVAKQNESTTSNNFNFDLQQYQIQNSTFTYNDETTKVYLDLHDISHSGKGDFSLATSILDTETTAQVSLKLDEVTYLNDNFISLTALIQMDLENQKYTFLENEALVNQLPLTFDGFVQVKENATALDLSFITPSSDFKNFLALIPEVYVKDIANVETTGDFKLNGQLTGEIDDTYIPKMDIKITSTNASFKYPNLPKKVENITIDAAVTNTTGVANDTFVNVNNLTFSIDDKPFSLSGNIKDIMNSVAVQLAIKGTLNLDYLDQIVPVELTTPLQGVVNADVNTQFTMDAINREQYDAIKTNGTATLSDFVYAGSSFKNPIAINRAAVTMSPGQIALNDLKASSGKTDLNATGTIENLIPWVMAKQDLKGTFNVQANTFNVNDFMSATETTQTLDTGKKVSQIKDAIKIPDFLDATLNFTANKVLYDDLELMNVKGTASIKDETAALNNVTSNFLGGTIALDGNVMTKSTTPTFTMNMDLSKVNLKESFEKLEMVKFLAPIAKSLTGLLTTKINISGNLSDDLTPVLESVTGNALAQISTAEADTSEMPLLNLLGNKLSFLDLERLSLRDIDTQLRFENGAIVVSPFDFNIKGIKVTASGRHALNKELEYQLNMEVPARYLGSDVTKLLSKLDPTEAEAMTVNLPVSLNGTFTSPAIDVDTKAAVGTLTAKLIEKQKQDAIDKGTNVIKDVLGDILPNNTQTNTTQQDSTTTKPTETIIKDAVEDVFGGLFGKKKKKSGGN